MNEISFLKQGLAKQGLPCYEADLPYIGRILHTVDQSEMSLNTFPHLNEEVPITIVDKELILYD